MGELNNDEIRKSVVLYYDDKIKTHGPVARGVDWNSEESQVIRFEKLLEIIALDPSNPKFSILDYGCGYGGILKTLKTEFSDFEFFGYDISQEMISAAKEIFKDSGSAAWYTELPADLQFDYVVASGIFNVKMNHSKDSWESYINENLLKINKISRKGFSVNFLTSFSDLEKMKDNLYYANPGAVLNFCIENFSRKVIIDHNYPLYEFTVKVFK